MSIGNSNKILSRSFKFSLFSHHCDEQPRITPLLDVVNEDSFIISENSSKNSKISEFPVQHLFPIIKLQGILVFWTFVIRVPS